MLKHMRVAMFIMAGVLVRSAVAAPNVVFILADDLGYGDLGCFFQNARPVEKMRLATPELDRMAAEGMMLTHHYSGAPVCVSARACLMTGFHTGHSPIKDNHFDSPLPPDGLTLPRMLKSAGIPHRLCWQVGDERRSPGPPRPPDAARV
jgi:arylsulfatase A-like enzyme